MKKRNAIGQVSSKKGRIIIDPHQAEGYRKRTAHEKYEIARDEYIVSTVESMAERGADKKLAKRAGAVEEAAKSAAEKVLGQTAGKEKMLPFWKRADEPSRTQ